MRYIIHIGLALAPLAALADPGHGAPVLHTHWWEVLSWAVAIGAVGWLVVKRIKSMSFPRKRESRNDLEVLDPR